MTSTAATAGTGPHSARTVLVYCLRTAARGLAVATVAGIAFQVGVIGMPWVVQRGIDEGIVPGDMTTTLVWALAAVGSAVLVFLAELALGWWSTLAGNRSGNVLHVGLVRHVLRLDRTALRPFAPGDLAMRGTRDIDVIREWLIGIPSLITGVGGFVMLIVAIGLLDPLLLVVVAVTLPLVVAVNLWFPRRFGPANADLSTAHAHRADAVEDLLTAAVAVRGIGAEQVLVDRHAPRSDEVARQTRRVGRISAGWAAVAPSVPRLAIGAGLAIGGAAALRGEVTVGELTAFVSWMSLITVWVGVIEVRLGELAAARTAGARVAEVLSAAPALATPPAPAALPERGDLRADGVTVEFDGRAPLGPFDLRVPPGELVAVTGPVGSGKSVLLRLLARVEDPSSGTVAYGGTDLRDVDPVTVRRRITLVPQRPLAVSGTVAGNLRLGRPDLSDEQVRAACRLAAFDVEGSLPDGFDTVVGEGGATLSGGQRQRLALASAVLRGAEVLLLDDVTSAVDEHTEALIVARLRGWLDGDGPGCLRPPSAVVVAGHRHSVLAAADRTVALAAVAADDATADLVRTDRG